MEMEKQSEGRQARLGGWLETQQGAEAAGSWCRDAFLPPLLLYLSLRPPHRQLSNLWNISAGSSEAVSKPPVKLSVV